MRIAGITYSADELCAIARVARRYSVIVVSDEIYGEYSGPALTAQLLEETGVAVLPGSDFGRAANELSLRLAYVNFDGAKALDGATEWENAGRIPDADFAHEYCAKTVEGIERLAE